MRILYYDWDEFNGDDLRDAMYRLGYFVEVLKIRLSDGRIRKSTCDELRERLKRAEDGIRFYDAVFSFDFFPEVSEVCQDLGVKYVSWVFDCPHYPLFSEQLANPVNSVHIFDRMLCDELEGRGCVTTIHHTPLAVNAERLKKAGLAATGEIDYLHDVSFIGNLYDNEFNFYDQASFPEELKEYLGDVFEAQQKIYGADILSDKRVISGDIMHELRVWISFENTGKFHIDYDRAILDILRKKVTILERRRIMEELGKRFNTVIYTTKDAKDIPGVQNLGLADYTDLMPRVFHRSKVNINITMRCIQSGIPLRVMDVLAAGGFLLTSYTPEIAEQFVDGEDLAIAWTPEELIEKAGYYLEHDDERKEIARRGQQKVFEKFGYERLLPEIFGNRTMQL